MEIKPFSLQLWLRGCPQILDATICGRYLGCVYKINWLCQLLAAGTLITMVLYTMPYNVSVYGLSDIGLVRHNNEDVWAQLSNERFYVLADGMGGHQAGEIAAREAVDHLCSSFKQRMTLIDRRNLREVRQVVFEVIQSVNQIVYRLGMTHEELKGMGTTLCCLLLHEEGVIYGHVGDSRIYRLRGTELIQLTRDDSLLRELIDLGQLNQNQVDTFIYKNIITKAIGTEPFIEPTVQVDTLLAGDVFLMCTDGLTDLLNQEEIRQIMLHSLDRDMAIPLIRAAKHKGGYDNITVVVVKVQEKYGTSDLSRS